MFVAWETILGRQLVYVYRFGIFTFRSVVLRWTKRGSSNIWPSWNGFFRA